MRHCTKCSGNGPFGYSCRTKDGLRPQCKACTNYRNRKLYSKDIELSRKKHQIKQRRLHATNKERYRETDRQRYANDPQHFRNKRKRNYWLKVDHSRKLSADYNRNRRVVKKDHVTRVEKAYRDNNPEKIYLKNLKRRLAQHSTRGKASLEQIKQRMAFFGNCCAYCNGPYEEVDHVIPLSRGGTNWPANLRPACSHCNRKKRNQIAQQWKNVVGVGDQPKFANCRVGRSKHARLSQETRLRLAASIGVGV